ncbi:unnamed protein product [Rhizoctonia solani]|uniref:Pectate lyase domain-containing protein n=1 Tax=Rhizoctonia solani TaxID=456999 RepID=A0A8H2WT09_9AGAM|nr:unnamed protein product [Rhizoctonia solani]
MHSLLTLAAVAAAYMIPQELAISAFPEAEGFGANAIGGRSVEGQLYIDTSRASFLLIHACPSGNFRDAVGASNRIVVFAVGGVIKISSRVVIKDHITIAGQTAPGGITIYGNGVSYSNAHHTITRCVRYRMGKGGARGKDGVGIGHDMIFDHVSVSWGRDETFSINGDVSNITISDSIIARGLETHSYWTRNPKVKGVNESVNNVVYNWGGGGGYITGGSKGQSYANIMNNVFISGPSTQGNPFTCGSANFRAYVQRNYYDPNKNDENTERVSEY